MNRSVATTWLLALSFGCPTQSTQAAPPDLYRTSLRPVFARHCVKCHGQQQPPEGQVDLADLDSAADMMRRPKLIERLIAVLADKEMPPADEPPLAPETRRAVVTHLKQLQRLSIAELGYSPVPLRRMNRFQYNNAVVDLFGLERDIFTLPEKLMRRYSDHFDPAKGALPPTVRVASRPLMKDVDNARAEGFMGVAAFPQDLRGRTWVRQSGRPPDIITLAVGVVSEVESHDCRK